VKLAEDTQIDIHIEELYSWRSAWNPHERLPIVDAIVRIGDSAVPRLIRRLRNSRTVRRSFLRGLRLFLVPDPATVHLVIALGLIGNPDAIDPLAEMLRSGHFTSEAIEALGRIGDRRALPILLEHLASGPCSSVYYRTLRAIVQVSDAADVRELCHLLPMRTIAAEDAANEHDSRLRTQVQEEIVRKLGAIRNPLAIRPLLSILDSDTALGALISIGPHDPAQLLGALDPISGLNGDVALRALIAFGKEAAPALRQLRGESPPCGRDDSSKGGGANWAPNLSIGLRCRAAVALTLIGEYEESLVPDLVTALEYGWSPDLVIEAMLMASATSRCPGLRAALPPLRRIARSRLSTSVRTAARAAIDGIEAATGEVRDVPITATAPLENRSNLPGVAHRSDIPREQLPISSSAGSQDEPASP